MLCGFRSVSDLLGGEDFGYTAEPSLQRRHQAVAEPYEPRELFQRARGIRLPSLLPQQPHRLVLDLVDRYRGCITGGLRPVPFPLSGQERGESAPAAYSDLSAGDGDPA